MTDKEYAAQKARIVKYLKKWREAGFAWFQVDHTFSREEPSKTSKDTAVAATCEAKWEYRTAYITWYLNMFTDKSDEEVERTVVHELAHVLIAPIQDFSSRNAGQMTEYTTSLVSDALIWASEMKKNAKT